MAPKTPGKKTTLRHLIHLIDASPYVFRAYFALPDSIQDEEGNPVGAVYGFASFLMRYIQEHRPTHLGLAFDTSLTTNFRNRIYPDYKANREEAPEELKLQFKRCQAVVTAFGAQPYAHRSYEADDLVGTLAAGFLKKGHRIRVVTSDKDLTQLVNRDLTVFDFGKNELLGPAEVKVKMGVAAGQVCDLLALAGDPVDNIPGVKGVGPKTAQALLQEFGDLDRVYKKLDQVENMRIRGARALRQKLEAGRELAYVSRQLAAIHCEVPVSARFSDLRYRGVDADKLRRLFKKLGFRGLLDRAMQL